MAVVIIRAKRTRRVPTWYVRHVMHSVQRLVAGNPGFQRLVIQIDAPHYGSSYWHEAAFLVNPDIEPQVRRLLGRVLVLDEPVIDDDPYELL